MLWKREGIIYNIIINYQCDHDFVILVSINRYQGHIHHYRIFREKDGRFYMQVSTCTYRCCFTEQYVQWKWGVVIIFLCSISNHCLHVASTCIILHSITVILHGAHTLLNKWTALSIGCTRS